MESCFPPLASLGRRDFRKIAEITVRAKSLSRTQPKKDGDAVVEPRSARPISTSRVAYDPSSCHDQLQDLDVFYIRQLARKAEEHDLERKIEVEIKMREGSARLLTAARHPRQSLEAARALLTSNARMSAYMGELQCRRKYHPLGKESAAHAAAVAVPSPSTSKLSLSDLRFPLMWRDTDHFKNRGDHRRFAVFCLARVGTEIQDTSLICPIDREQTDISFPDVLSFENVPPDFELVLEIYSHVLQEDLSMASTPRRIRRTIHSSISRTVGKKLMASWLDELDLGKTDGPRFDLVANAKMTLNDSHTDTRTHELTLTNVGNKQRALPLFGHFCCRLAVQPDCTESEMCSGNLKLNGVPCWARLRGFALETWACKSHADERREAARTIPITKNIVIEGTQPVGKEFRIVERTAARPECPDSVQFDSVDEAERWFECLSLRMNDHARWKHAAVTLQTLSCPNSTSSSGVPCFANDAQGTLYDQIGTGGPNTNGGNATATASVGWAVPLSCSNIASKPSNSRRTFSGITRKSRWTFSDRNRR